MIAAVRRRSGSRRVAALGIVLLLIVGWFVYLPGAGTVEAAPSFTVSPVSAAAASLPARVTVTASQSAFTAGGSTPYLMVNGQVQPANITNIASTTTQVAFTVGAGLAEGTYTIKIVSQAGTYDSVGTFTVGNAAVTAIDPDSLAHNYDEQVSLTVTGQNTNFTLGQSSVEILNGQNQAVGGAVGGVTAVPSTSRLTFTLNTGLSTGTYSVRITTGDEAATGAGLLEVRGAPSISLSDSTMTTGYSTTAITVTGTNTGFSDATTVAVLDANGNATGKAGTPTVNSATSLSFSLSSGLAAGSYTVRVTTGSEVATAALSVATPSAALRYQGNSFSQAGAGYASAYSLTITGTDTGFAQGTTSVALFDANDQDITGTYVSNVSVSSATAVAFTLATGLEAGTYTVQATTGDEVVSAEFEVVSPSVQSITFNSAVANGTTLPAGYQDIQQVDVVGTNSNFQANTTVTVVGQAGQTSSLNASDATHLSFALKSGLGAGAYTLRIDMDGSGNTTTDRADVNFTVTSPSLTSATPASLTNGSSTPVTITVVGANTHFTQATPTVDITGTDGETISSVTAVSDTQLTFSLTPNSIATPGSFGISVTTNSAAIRETATGAALLTVADSGISAVSPSVVYADELGSRQITVTGSGTSFAAGTTTAKIDGTAVSGLSVGSTTSLSFTVPVGLSAGSRTLTIDEDGDGTDDYTTSFLVSQRAISLATTSKTFGYSSFTQTVTGQGITFSADNKPAVKVLQGGTEKAAVSAANITVVDASHVSFPFPTGLAAGSYTVQFSWNSGGYSGLSLTSGFTVNHQISSLYLKKDGQVVNTVTVYESSGSFSLTAWGVMVTPGADQEKTASATWQITSGADVASVSNGTVQILGPGSAKLRASYDGQTAEVTVSVQSLQIQSLTLSRISGSQSIVAGQTTATVRATGTMNDSSQQDLTSVVTWNAIPAGALAVSSSGVVNGTTATPGTVTLTATYNNVTSGSLSFEVSVATTGLTISPDQNLSVTVGGSTLTLKANAIKSYGEAADVTSLATWSTSDATRATVNAGVVTAAAAGSVTITAAYGDDQASVAVTVNAAGSAGGGAGGAIAGPPPAVATDVPLTAEPVVSGGIAQAEVDTDQLVQKVAAVDEATVAVEVRAVAGAAEVRVLLAAAAVTALAAGEKNLELRNQVAPVILPATVLGDPTVSKLLAGGASLELAARSVSDAEGAAALATRAEEAVPAGTAVELNLNVVKPDGSRVSIAKFADRVWVTLAYDTTKLGHVSASKLGVYRRNPVTGAWDYVGGRVDATAKTVQVGLKSFSLYTVMAYDKTFADLASHWSRADVELMASRHVVKGISADAFAPEEPVTRAQFAALLVRALDLTYGGNTLAFSDVRPADWFYREVATAYSFGLVNGLSSKSFAPTARITREQMATMVARALEVRGIAALTTAEVAATLQAFADQDGIATWALKGTAMAVNQGIILGRTSSTFVPKADATRAEAAVMLKRLMTVLELL